ncbi:four helix bundle protein [Xylanibacter ruminicola]|nr:four helix bundle protein [Xylanibacter ruminicola]
MTIYYLTIGMTELELKERFKKFSIRIIKMVDSMPDTISGRAIGSQVVRSGTSPAANYRAACLGKSEKDFLNKLKMVEEELDETSHWLEVIMETGMLPENRVKPLYTECLELLKIIISSIVSTRKHLDCIK